MARLYVQKSSIVIVKADVRGVPKGSSIPRAPNREKRIIPRSMVAP